MLTFKNNTFWQDASLINDGVIRVHLMTVNDVQQRFEIHGWHMVCGDFHLLLIDLKQKNIT